MIDKDYLLNILYPAMLTAGLTWQGRKEMELLAYILIIGGYVLLLIVHCILH